MSVPHLDTLSPLPTPLLSILPSTTTHPPTRLMANYPGAEAQNNKA